MKVKRCPNCGVEGDAAELFYRSKHQPDGFQTWCKKCQGAARRKHREEKPEMAYQTAKRWREGNAERHAENARKWVEANRERHNENSRRWRNENPERSREFVKNWIAKNPEQAREHVRRRRARLASSTATLTPVEWKAVLEAADHKCVYCLAPYEEQDHVVPLALGGAHAFGNVVPACGPCNRRKWSKTLDEWIEHAGLDGDAVRERLARLGRPSD